MNLPKKLGKYAGILPIIVLISACNGSSNTSGVIENNSSYQLKILLYGGGGRLSDTLIFNPGTERLISQKEYSSATEIEENCAERYDSMYALAGDSGWVTKRIQDESNWEVITDQTKHIPREFEHNCRFKINNSDIEF